MSSPANAMTSGQNTGSNTAPNRYPGVQDLLYWYPILPPQLTALQQNVFASVAIQNDAEFEWRWIIGNSTGLFSVTFTDGYTTRPLSLSPINGENTMGSAKLPFIMPKPYVLHRTSTVNALFNDRSGAANTIQLCLVGYKLS
jgi:hypothetical protein